MKAAVTFSAGYAKRMMEGKYNRFFQSEAGKMLAGLNRPSKQAIEFALNTVAAYLATKDTLIANAPLQQFLWEVAKDAPSELSKRLLNGDHKPSAAPNGSDVDVSEDEKQAVLNGLLRMEPEDLSAFAEWIGQASPDRRRLLAEVVSRLTEDEQRKFTALTPKQAMELLASSNTQTAPLEARTAQELVANDLEAARTRLAAQLG